MCRWPKTTLAAKLYWYHTSPYERWPDAEALAAAFEAQIANGPALGPFTPQQLLEQHPSKAVHIGTYEAVASPRDVGVPASGSVLGRRSVAQG